MFVKERSLAKGARRASPSDWERRSPTTSFALLDTLREPNTSAPAGSGDGLSHAQFSLVPGC